MQWAFFIVFVVIAIAVDFFAMSRGGARRVSIRAAALWSLVWVALSFVFVGLLWWYLGGASGDAAAREIAHTKALEFVTGYLIEKALAIDNIFVFLLVFTYFQIPLEFQKRVLMIGVMGALVLRAIMILIGAWLISEFHWILYLFGFFLVYTGFKMWKSIGKEPDLESSAALRWLKKGMHISTRLEGEKLFIMESGKRVATPLFAVILLIGIVDVLFAVDSIPAIFAVTTDPFIVLTSNVFAILGLRAMYFLLAGMHEKFHLLSYGLSFVLVFIGMKMILIDIFKIPVYVSLGVTVSALAASMILSVYLPQVRGGSSYPFAPKPGDETPGA